MAKRKAGQSGRETKKKVQKMHCCMRQEAERGAVQETNRKAQKMHCCADAVNEKRGVDKVVMGLGMEI